MSESESAALAAAPPSLLDVQIILSREQYFADGGDVLVTALVTVRPTAENVNAPPLDLRFVVDSSGSMGESVPSGQEKIRVVGAGLADAARVLTQRDSTMLVFFSYEHQVVVAHAAADASVVEQVITQVAQRRASGGTSFAGALGAVLAPPARKDGTQTHIVFFTDGNNQGDGDTALTVAHARRSRELGIAWNIYATGEDYNWAFLEQLVAQAGPGSQLYHVSDPTVLASHLVGEVAFLRQVAVDRLVITGTTQGAELTRVYAFLPAERVVETDGTMFRDDSGALDISRGQRLFVELKVKAPRPGTQTPLTLRLAGRSMGAGLSAFSVDIDVPVMFMDDPQLVVSPVNPEVVRVEELLKATAAAREGKFQEATEAFRRAGDPAAAAHMTDLGTLAARGRDVDATRSATTFATRSMAPPPSHHYAAPTRPPPTPRPVVDTRAPNPTLVPPVDSTGSSLPVGHMPRPVLPPPPPALGWFDDAPTVPRRPKDAGS